MATQLRNFAFSFVPKSTTIANMKTVTPFLVRFAKPCKSPARDKPSLEFFYDESCDMVRYRNGADDPLAIEIDASVGPTTKKCDIEKGEDQKDRRMWG
jgi:hypothetical protein